MPARLPSFWVKVLLAMGVVALADWALFEAGDIGMNLAVVLGAATAALALTRPAVWRDRLGRWALAAAALLALLPVERPSLVGFLLWVLAIAVATLSPRAARDLDGWRWGQRLVVAGAKAFFLWIKDLRVLLQARGRTTPTKLTAVLLAAALPVVGGLIFLELFAAANPVIAAWQASVQFAPFYPGRVVFWLVIAFPTATILRPRGLKATFAAPGVEGDLNLPGVTAASVTAALAVFNAVFAIQNGLDIAYLWSGAGLPHGMTFADYAHRAAYPLIITALLAGLFVVVFLRPGSATAGRPAVRWLVSAWVAQNLFLVASTALRMADYIEAYSLTRTRIAALVWMGLVALGLALILWRVLAAKSSGWLINANLAVLGVVLLACSAVDFGAFAAAWNVRHAREVGGKGVQLDVGYLVLLRGAALVPLAQLDQSRPPPQLACEVAEARGRLIERTATQQAHWRSWRFRDARRLARARAIVGANPPKPQFIGPCGCRVCPVERRIEPPLTPSANPRT